MSAAGDEAQPSLLSKKQIIAAVVFTIMAIAMGQVVPTVEVAWVCAVLIFTIYLFAFEVVDVDVAAVTVMVLLGLTSLLAPVMGLSAGLVDVDHLFDGFASNAVISIIAVMIIGAGLDKTGLMTKVAGFILNVGGTTETRIIPIISSTVAIISSFMQNVGAAALFLPVVSRISARSGLPMSRLLMPMGFCAILGGTVTMIGSSPLILLNDLILTINQGVPADKQMETWSLFSVTPIGLALVATGIIYFVLAGKFVLPVSKANSDSTSGSDTVDYLKETYGLEYSLYEVVISEGSSLVGSSFDDIEMHSKIRVVGSVADQDDMRIGPGMLNRDIQIQAGTVLAILSSPQHAQDFVQEYELELKVSLETFEDALSSSKAGIADVVIAPGSSMIGKSARDVWLRKSFGLAMVAMHRGGNTLREGDGIRDMPLQAGDTLVVHTTWDAYHRISTNRDFIQVTTEYPHEETRPNKVGWAAVFFTIALGLILLTDIKLSVALLTGAIGMVWSRVLSIEEAYEAVSWKTVFLLASLIPLGVAVQGSGTADWIANQVLSVVGEMDIWVIQASIAALATFFTLVMSNVGATVLLVPLAVSIANGVPGADPAIFALTVAIATSNSFLIPTHQVNALIMGPGGYRVPDFMRAGGIMTILFLVVMIFMMNLVL
ncbi:MAG: SLC13 family permease [Methylococcales bacterium]|jgi:di/tricarboxylate transporter|nr:SLC13 family permease [Methylococcales bacterium]